MESYTPSVFEDIEPQIVRASRTKRFWNFLVDYIAYYLIVQVITFLVAWFFPDFFYGTYVYSLEFRLWNILFSIVLYGLLMGTFEAVSKGKSIGKLFTGTRAVNEDGSRINARTAFLRGFSKAVPFEAFSALSGYTCHPWHDRWTKTYVIDEKQSQLEQFPE